jgi:hypothetical protein
LARYLLLLGFSGLRKEQDCSHGRTILQWSTEIDVRFERLLDVNFFEFDREDLPEKRAHERASNMRGRLAWRVNARPQNVLTVQALRVVAALLKGFLEPWRVVQAQFLRWGYLRGQSGHHFGARRQNSMNAASEPT